MECESPIEELSMAGLSDSQPTGIFDSSVYSHTYGMAPRFVFVFPTFQGKGKTMAMSPKAMPDNAALPDLLFFFFVSLLLTVIRLGLLYLRLQISFGVVCLRQKIGLVFCTYGSTPSGNRIWYF